MTTIGELLHSDLNEDDASALYVLREELLYCEEERRKPSRRMRSGLVSRELELAELETIMVMAQIIELSSCCAGVSESAGMADASADAFRWRPTSSDRGRISTVLHILSTSGTRVTQRSLGLTYRRLVQVRFAAAGLTLLGTDL